MNINKKNPLVSVVIPAYNHENYVQDTIKSIINQTYKNIELIIIDDGSTDSTLPKIQAMQKICKERFVNTHFETKKNEGTCKTLNKLLSLVNGKYIYMIASDDMAKPQAIEKELSFLEKNSDYALCVGNNEFIDKNNKVCFWDNERNIVYNKHKAKYLTFCDELRKNRADMDFTSEQFGSYTSLILGNYIPNGYLIKKSILNNFKFTPEAPLEDWNLMLHISKYAKMKFLNEILFSYRWHSSNTAKQTEKMIAMTNKTRKYESILLKKLNLNNCLPDVKNTLQMKKYKSIGIPYILILEKYKNCFSKTKIVKLFNFNIMKFSS